MVGHQDIGVKLDRILLAGLTEMIEVELEIVFRKETGIPVVAPLDDMHRNSRQFEPWSLTLTKADPFMLKIIDPLYAQLFVGRMDAEKRMSVLVGRRRSASTVGQPIEAVIGEARAWRWVFAVWRSA